MVTIGFVPAKCKHPPKIIPATWHTQTATWRLHWQLIVPPKGAKPSAPYLLGNHTFSHPQQWISLQSDGALRQGHYPPDVCLPLLLRTPSHEPFGDRHSTQFGAMNPVCSLIYCSN